MWISVHCPFGRMRRCFSRIEKGLWGRGLFRLFLCWALSGSLELRRVDLRPFLFHKLAQPTVRMRAYWQRFDWLIKRQHCVLTMRNYMKVPVFFLRKSFGVNLVVFL